MHLRNPSDIVALTDEELIDLFEFKCNPVIRFYEYLGVSGSEWNYAVGAPINAMTSISHVIPPSVGIGFSLGWNYLDAVYSIGLGIIQLTDEEDYRQTQNTIKGVLNIFSGTQMLLFSYNPIVAAALGIAASGLAVPSFALSLFIDLMGSIVDVCHATKESEFEGWLDERAQEMDYNEKRILKFKNAKPESALEKQYIELKTKILKDKNEKIEDDIYARSRAYCNSDAKREKTISILKQYKNTLPIENQLNNTFTPEDYDRDRRIQKRLTENKKEKTNELILKAFSSAGMILLTVASFVSCPPVLFLGLAITSIVAGIYLYRNSEKIVSAINSCSTIGFFSQKPNNDDRISPPAFRRA